MDSRAGSWTEDWETTEVGSAYLPEKQRGRTVGLLDGAMHVWAVLYKATRIKALCIEGSYWN
jgi:hypothetical protein